MRSSGMIHGFFSNPILRQRAYRQTFEVQPFNSRLVENMSKPLNQLVKALKSIAMRFVEAINNGDSESLIKLQTEDFTLIDADGGVFRGRDGWEGYFSDYPKYRIHVQHVLTGGNGVAIIGKTTGSQVAREIEENETVFWTAEIRDDLVAEWRLYTDIRGT